MSMVFNFYHLWVTFHVYDIVLSMCHKLSCLFPIIALGVGITVWLVLQEKELYAHTLMTSKTSCDFPPI